MPLTSFSILFARYKGRLDSAVRGVTALRQLQDGDTVLISEGCTHHRQCDDIGTVKLPKWIEDYTGKSLHFEFTSGGAFPENLSPYQLIVHCGGCMLNEREMKSRIALRRGRGCTDDQLRHSDFLYQRHSPPRGQAAGAGAIAKKASHRDAFFMQ